MSSSHANKGKKKATINLPVAGHKGDSLSTAVLGLKIETNGAKSAGKGQHYYKFVSIHVCIIIIMTVTSYTKHNSFVTMETPPYELLIVAPLQPFVL